GTLREGRFARFGSLKEMQDALAAATDREPSEHVKQSLLTLWPKNAESLRQALDARLRERTESLKRTLEDRRDKEATDIRLILAELLESIQKELDDPQLDQSFLPGLAPLEREQFERNYDALRVRVRAIPEEIDHEVKAVRARFADPQARM